MVWIIAVILLAIWAVGFFTSATFLGLIHLLLVDAVLVLAAGYILKVVARKETVAWRGRRRLGALAAVPVRSTSNRPRTPHGLR